MERVLHRTTMYKFLMRYFNIFPVKLFIRKEEKHIQETLGMDRDWKKELRGGSTVRSERSETYQMQPYLPMSWKTEHVQWWFYFYV